jgi:outer membrane lipoprotein SlyB
MSRQFLIPFHAALIFLLVSCSIKGEGDRYRVASIGNAKRSIEAEVISSSPVMITSGTSGAGGVIGGITGGLISSNNSNNAAIIFLGIATGIIIGDAIESATNIHEGTEYTIETDSDAIFTVVQINKGNTVFQSGDNVILVYGYPSRLIRDPR